MGCVAAARGQPRSIRQQLLDLRCHGHLQASLCLIAPVPPHLLMPLPCCARCAQVPMHSASGVKVQYLKVWEKSSYKVDKWVRKLCKSGDYQIRL
jgi:AP-2 complex subunit mu-1